MSNALAHVTVSRPGPGTLSDNYPITMSLDGEPIARLMAGRSVTREVEAGHHRLRANNTLMWKTVEFDVAPGEHVRFVASNRSGSLTTIMAIIGTGWFYVDLEETRDEGTKEPRDEGTGERMEEGTKEAKDEGTKEPKDEGTKEPRKEGTRE